MTAREKMLELTTMPGAGSARAHFLSISCAGGSEMTYQYVNIGKEVSSDIDPQNVIGKIITDDVSCEIEQSMVNGNVEIVDMTTSVE